jgi:hypothetical protein
VAAALASAAGSLVLFAAPGGRAMAQGLPGGGGGGGGFAPAGDRALQREQRIRDLQQLELDQRLRANQEIPVGQRALIDYGGFYTFSYLSLDDESNDNRVLRQHEVVGFVRLNLDGAHEFFARGRWGYRDFHRGDSFDGRGDEPIDGDLERGYYRFDYRRYRAAYFGDDPGFDFTAEGGRDLAYWANGLVLAEVLDGGFINVGNERANFEFVYGHTPTRTVDFDTSRPNFDHNTNRAFLGLMASLNLGEHRPFVYALSQQDHNPDDFLPLGPITTRYQYDSNYFGVGSVGSIADRLRYGVEFAYEGGKNLSNSFALSGAGGLIPVGQTRDHIHAYAMDAKLDYLLADPNQSRLSTEFIFASGDNDRGHTSNTFNGNKPNTDDEAFNAFGLLNTGLAFSPSVSNIMAGRIGASTFPFPDSGVLRRLQIGVDVFGFGKFDDDAPIDEPTTAGVFYLGWEPDVYLNWQVTSDVTLALRYGVFFPNADAFEGNDESRQFFYGGITFAF